MWYFSIVSDTIAIRVVRPRLGDIRGTSISIVGFSRPLAI